MPNAALDKKEPARSSACPWEESDTAPPDTLADEKLMLLLVSLHLEVLYALHK